MPQVCQPLAMSPPQWPLAARFAIGVEPLRVVLAREVDDLLLAHRRRAERRSPGRDGSRRTSSVRFEVQPALARAADRPAVPRRGRLDVRDVASAPRARPPPCRAGRRRRCRSLSSRSSSAMSGRALAHQVLHVTLGLAGRARESEVDVDEVLRQVHAAGRSTAAPPACGRRRRASACRPRTCRARRRRRSVIARIGAEPVPVQIISEVARRMIRHQERVAERADHAARCRRACRSHR